MALSAKDADTLGFPAIPKNTPKFAPNVKVLTGTGHDKQRTKSNAFKALHKVVFK